MNDTLNVIFERFSCRSYSDKMPSKNDLNLILKAAAASPSGHNRQPWQIILIKNRELMREIEEEGMRIISGAADQSTNERIKSRGGLMFYNAPCMIVVAINSQTDKNLTLIDCGIAAQNICLAATSLGIANVHCGMAGMVFNGENGKKFKEMAKFPENYEFGMSVLLGYANKVTGPHSLNLEKITRIE